LNKSLARHHGNDDRCVITIHVFLIDCLISV